MNKICETIENDIEKFKSVVSESNGTGDICKKYKFSDNGRSRNIIKEFIVILNLNTNHFGIKSHKRKYTSIEKECPICKKIFTTQKDHPREKSTCSCNCGNKFFKRTHSDEEKTKISNSLKKYNSSIGKISIDHKKECKFCKNLFIIESKHKQQQYCSTECRSKCPELRKKLSDIIKLKVENGTHSGWKFRNEISYPEKFFMNVLNNNDISYIHDKPAGKYFIDFAIEQKKIALEIDGKQHLLTERKLKDEEKDAFLIKNNWIVYRIPWNNINNDNGKQLMKQKIDEFLKFYNESC